jgi:ribosomal protein S14
LKKNILKQKSLVKAIKNSEESNSILKLIVNTEILPLSIREECASRLHMSAIKKTVRRVCTLTGRARGVVCKEKLSRLSFKRLIEKGLVSGIKKV